MKIPFGVHTCRSALLALALSSAALSAAETKVIELWPEGVPGLRLDSPPETESEGRFTNVSRPTLTMFAPAVEKSTGVAMIVAPGGGYVRVGDGATDARWLNSLGITAFVLKYRLNNYGHPAPLQDMLRAVRTVRSRAAEFGVRPDRIGVMGGSAGGHLAGCAATLWDSPLGTNGSPLDATSARPDFAALIYPVVTMSDPFVHKGSRSALFGNEPTSEQIELLSIEKHVRSNSPPCFIVATMADRSVPVENSLRLYQALHDVGVPSELHSYSAGSHGDSRDAQYGPTAEWPKRCEEWIRFNRWLPPEKHDSSRWESEIAALEASHKTNPAPRDALLFIGSSTVRLWKTLPQDLPDTPVINHGFGGSQIADATAFANRMIFPFAPKKVLLRAGGNDLFAGKSPEQIFAEFREFVATVQAKLPETEIIYISQSPSIARWPQAAREKRLNELAREFIKDKPRLGYLDTYDLPLGPDGKPRAELFVSDKLHFNAEGYKLLAERTRQFLKK